MTIQEPSFRTIRPVEQFGAFRDDDVGNVQVAERKPNRSVDKCIQNGKLSPVAKTQKLPATVTFRPGPEDYKIIQAGKSKHGLKKTVDVLRMALRRFAESDGIKVSG